MFPEVFVEMETLDLLSSQDGELSGLLVVDGILIVKNS